MAVLFDIPMRPRGKHISCSIKKGISRIEKRGLYHIEGKVMRGEKEVDMTAQAGCGQVWLIWAELGTPIFNGGQRKEVLAQETLRGISVMVYGE